MLISGEQFGLGGLGSVRGTRIERPVSGDKGITSSVEITTPELAAGLLFLGFVDAGLLGNNGANDFGKPSRDRLASVGLGLRYGAGPFSPSADYGRLLISSRVPPEFNSAAPNSAAPREGDDRFYVGLSLRF